MLKSSRAGSKKPRPRSLHRITRRRKRKIYGYVNGLTSRIRLKQPYTRCNGYPTIAIELLSSSIIAKSDVYSVSAIVRQLNIDNILQLRVTGKVYGNITLEQKLPFPRGSGL